MKKTNAAKNDKTKRQDKNESDNQRSKIRILKIDALPQTKENHTFSNKSFTSRTYLNVILPFIATRVISATRSPQPQNSANSSIASSRQTVESTSKQTASTSRQMIFGCALRR
uniref:Uncharacterized protein n=1 Tax=Romanomermis culicivorax TaxID=13658 RepID=A0A915IM66_ROMCU